jgi:ABC-2 type transport system permease protein
MQQLDRYISNLGKVGGSAVQPEPGKITGAGGRTAEQTPGNAANPATGFAVTFMMILVFTTIGIILEDKRKLTLARMYVSPVKEWEIILGNLLGSLALGVFQLIALTAALMISYDVRSASKAGGLFLILFCFLIAVTGIGIGISGLIKKAYNPATLIAAVITPTGVLGGCFIPESMLPDFVNRIGYLVPQKWVMGAINKVLGGEGLGSVTLNLAVIILFGLAFAAFGLKMLRPLAD